MSRIDELIRDLCPEGVPFLKLQNVAKIRNGKDYKSFPAGPIPVFGTGGVMTSIDRAAYEGPSVLIPRKGSLDQLYFVEEPFWTVDTIFYTEIDETQVRPKFFYYYLKTQRLEELNQAGGIPSLTQKVLNRLSVPVPPLEVQEEIVRILDAFSALTAELEAELEARRTQYEHYRDDLLKPGASGDHSWRWAELGEVITLNFGERITKKEHSGAQFPVYGGGGESFRTDAYNREDEYVISRFAMSETCVRRVPGPFWLLDSGLTFDPSMDGLLKDYVGQWLFNMQSTIFATASQSAQKNLKVPQFKKLPIAFPSLEEQRRIVALLKRFEALTTDLRSGLPAEIQARRKQYEYYRDRLLTFEEVPA